MTGDETEAAAKIDGTVMTASTVPRADPGVESGPQEGNVTDAVHEKSKQRHSSWRCRFSDSANVVMLIRWTRRNAN